MARSCIPRPDAERGVALVIALLVLMVISVLATVLMVSVNVDTKITSHGLSMTEALNNAEAGVGEAQARLASGDVDLNSNAHAVAQIFNVAAGSVPVLGTDSAGFATAQPSGAWLAYSTATRGPRALTVQYKTDNARTSIYKYDSSKNPAVGLYSSGNPIYVVTSTGTAGTDMRTVRAEIYAKPVTAYQNVPGALTANVGVRTVGTFDVCGLNHRADIPAGTQAGHGACTPYHTSSDDKAGIWSTSTIDAGGGASTVTGNPDAVKENMTTGPGTGTNGFFAGPWEVLGMTQAAFFSWLGSPITCTPASPADGNYYVNDVSDIPSSGSGFLYIDGDVSFNGGFTWTGVIYVKGDVKKVNGHAWILGALIVEGEVDMKLNGTADILYSADAISQALSSADGTYLRLSWREIPSP